MGSHPRIGKLPARYKFLLNPHASLRASRCPICNKLTYPRKFALLVHVDGWGPFVVGKTCKFCSKEQLIICHQDELDTELARAFTTLNPQVIGDDYRVLGTIEMGIFKTGLTAGHSLGELLEHTADFKKHIDLAFDPGGWRNADADPARYMITAKTAAARRKTPWTTKTVVPDAK